MCVCLCVNKYKVQLIVARLTTFKLANATVKLCVNLNFLEFVSLQLY